MRSLHKFTDTPMYREEYRELQIEGLKFMGRYSSPADFNEMVKREIEYQGVQATAQNWVNVAGEVVANLILQDQQHEPDVLTAEAM